MAYDKADYLADPIGTSALAYWKRHHPIPSRIKVYHERDYRPELAEGKQVERYFRLIHLLSYIRPYTIPEGMILRQLTKEDDEALVRQIRQAYHDQGISVDQTKLQSWKEFPVYYPKGWLGLFQDDELVASIICEVDPEIKEGIVDWLQVSYKYQGQGFGKLILLAALHRLKEVVDFVTVSGSLENENYPEAVYRKCGFIGQDIWYIVVA